jgi:hypothetical protein
MKLFNQSKLILIAFAGVLCMGALTKPGDKMKGGSHWRVDATIAGANPSLGTVSVASYTGIENAGLTLTNNPGRGILTAQIPCSSTNSPSGTTCSAGNESIGVSFTIPEAVDVRACASFTHVGQPVTSAGNNFTATFQIIETPNNAQTLTQEGKSKVQHRITAEQAAVASIYAAPFRVCGTFTFSTSGQKTLRLMYEQAIPTGTISFSQILGDQDAAHGQPDIHWEIEPLASY